MERHELPEVLYKNIDAVKPYPLNVEPVKEMINITAFFPGGKGLWMEEESEDLPSILVLGQDFSTVKQYEDMLVGKASDLESPTWRNLIKLFNEAELDLKECYFSNVFMGLRDTEKMTGEFPGFKDKSFVARNVEFLSFQIETIKPRVIIALGKYAAEMLTYLPQSDLSCWSKWKALREANNGLKFDVTFSNHNCTCIALEHPSMRNSNVKRRVYGKYKGHEAEVEMLKEVVRTKHTSISFA